MNIQKLLAITFETDASGTKETICIKLYVYKLYFSSTCKEVHEHTLPDDY